MFTTIDVIHNETAPGGNDKVIFLSCVLVFQFLVPVMVLVSYNLLFEETSVAFAISIFFRQKIEEYWCQNGCNLAFVCALRRCFVCANK